MSDAADSRERPTVELEPMSMIGDQPSWSLTNAVLERHGEWATLAFRLGILALLQECVRAMAEPNARVGLVMTARELVDALAHLSWDA